MKFIANQGKRVEIAVAGTTYLRHAIQTRFITTRDNYIDLIREYVLPLYEEGDLLSISEKVISICQHRIKRREDIRVSFWARFLARFASPASSRGVGVSEPVKMQYAIDQKGLARILAAGVAGGFCKLFGIKGVFYRIAGQEVSGLDGFYDGVWDEYKDIGIEIPKDPDAVCDEIKKKLGVLCMIVDANDLGQEILGKCSSLSWDEALLKQLIRDNPAGQSRQRTPFILIRRKG